MKHYFILLMVVSMLSCIEQEGSERLMTENPTQEYVLVIHGGAGTITRSGMTPDMEEEYRSALSAALDAGEKILSEGGSAMDAVVASVKLMEDSPLFNAGKGAVFTHAGTIEMDASVMDGATHEAGAVAGVQRIRNPVLAARAVMENTDHVMLSGEGADNFAEMHGLAMEDPDYFYTERRWQSLQEVIRKQSHADTLTEQEKHGTVGAVALDTAGNLAAATSTGGMTNKKFGRIGDTPVIGAGTYADNATCAVSCTGHGEYFIRYAVAHEVSAAMEHGAKSLHDAAHQVIHTKLPAKGGTGGLIAVDAKGNLVMEFNTEGMYRGYAKPGERVIRIYQEEGE